MLFRSMIVIPTCTIVVGDARSIPEGQVAGIEFNGLSLSPAFSQDVTTYTLAEQAYGKSSIGLKVNAADTARVTVRNNQGQAEVVTPNAASWKNVALQAGTNQLEVTIAPTVPADALPRIYNIAVKRNVALKNLGITTTDGATVVIKEAIAPATTAYTATAISGKEVGFALEAHGDAANSKFLVNGAAVASGYTLSDGVNHFAIQVRSEERRAGKECTLLCCSRRPPYH